MKENIENLLKELKIPGKELNIIKEAIDKNIIELIYDTTYMFLFKFNNDVAYEFYCEDLLENAKFEKPISFIDLCYSKETDDALIITKRNHDHFCNLIQKEVFNANKAEHIKELICYLAYKLNLKEYEKYKTIYDIDKDIPLEVFFSIFNNQKDSEEVVFNVSETRMAGMLNHLDISRTIMGTSFYATIFIMTRGIDGKFKMAERTIEIYPKKSFIRALNDLDIEILSEKEKVQLIKRGKKYISLTEKPYYCRYSGFAFAKNYMNDSRISVNSRVMIDLKAMKQFKPNIDDHWYYGGAAFVGEGTIEPDYNLLWSLSPVVYGFAFGNKQWCRMSVENIEEIVFSETAFDDLIIPQGNKDLFIACMTNPMPSLDDIEDKGEGKIFLLYGPPGVGKTLTAESTAEYLHKPLYFVSVGELGTDPKELEESLNKVMSIATSWDAIILLDEVDVFAIKREDVSIERNAMTAIFLRTLERYSGIMFMTTNLLNNLDPAFISRATAVIEYNDLESEERAAIWSKVIKKIEKLKEVTIEDDVYKNINNLAENYAINGRLIKNTARLAYTLALSRDKVLKTNDIISALSVRKIIN